jgi:hypothetical protein
LGQGGQKPDDAGGAVDDKVRGLRHLRRFRALAGDGTAGDAVGAQVAERGEGREVPQVIAAEQHGAGRAFGGKVPQGGSLVHAGRPQLEYQPAGFERERGAVSEPLEWLSQERQCRRRVRGPSRVDGERRPLVFHGGSLGRGHRGEQPGQRLSHGLDAWGRGRRAEHARLPSLRAVVPENDQPGHLGEATERHRVRGRPAGDNRHRADTAGQPGQCRHGTGRGHRRGRIIDDRGEGAVVIGSDERVRWIGRDRGKSGLTISGPGAGQGHRYLVPGWGDRMRWRRARCARSRLTSTGSNLSASGRSISSLSNW